MDSFNLVKRAIRLGLVDHRIGVRCLLCNEEGGDSLFHVLVKCPSLVHIRNRIEGFVHVANLLTEVIPVYDQALRECEVQGDGSQLGLAEGPSGSDTTFEPTPERVGPTFHQGMQWSSGIIANYDLKDLWSVEITSSLCTFEIALFEASVRLYRNMWTVQN
eukprot:Gb_38886 [translate_table: standard]